MHFSSSSPFISKLSTKWVQFLKNCKWERNLEHEKMKKSRKKAIEKVKSVSREILHKKDPNYKHNWLRSGEN